MRFVNRSRIALVALVALVMSACASTPPAVTQYRTIAGVKLAVDTGMKAFADRVVTGQTTPAQEAQVKAAFEKYTAAAKTAAAVMRATSDPASSTLTAAADALLALLASFGVHTGGV